MIDHISITVSNLARSRAFYEAALAPLGYQTLHIIEGVALGMGRPEEGPDLWMEVGTPGAAVHVALRGPNQQAVDTFHRAALEAGGIDHGAPGLRPQYHAHYYGAFILDPDGHNLEAVCHDELGSRPDLSLDALAQEGAQWDGPLGAASFVLLKGLEQAGLAASQLATLRTSLHQMLPRLSDADCNCLARHLQGCLEGRGRQGPWYGDEETTP